MRSCDHYYVVMCTATHVVNYKLQVFSELVVAAVITVAIALNFMISDRKLWWARPTWKVSFGSNFHPSQFAIQSS